MKIIRATAITHNALKQIDENKGFLIETRNLFRGRSHQKAGTFF